MSVYLCVTVTEAGIVNNLNETDFAARCLSITMAQETRCTRLVYTMDTMYQSSSYSGSMETEQQETGKIAATIYPSTNDFSCFHGQIYHNKQL